jgi:hypothetical protein
MKCPKCGKFDFPEFENWEEFMNNKLKTILHGRNTNAYKKKASKRNTR